MRLRRVLVPLFGSALAALMAATASAGPPTPLCQRELDTSYASLNGNAALRAGPAKSDDACAAYRTYFVNVVRARAVTAQCVSGSERDRQLSKLDIAAEQANAAIADRCH
ncbi:MAG: hypothetical protein KJZ73_12540 [Pseudorhodoplanes sp.]|nr:hypothetical protein [Pseudorhodoplanes sp.]MBW7947973.1 hypothetical protein [Pseudorhodoplanes sp.]MCL4712063.1 hypothetical protein [Pseudorhodoplanes sp.]GIK81690.1 MAG: hypothetical protein BroJett024_27950 [Alphaproteobacteria bacterium]